MKSLASTTPNAQYEWFDRLLTRKIGTAIGTPYEFVALDFSQTNFSNARAALLQAYRTFEGWQTGHCEPIFRRHWNWKIAKAIKAGDIRPAPIVDGRSTWWMMDLSWPEWDWVDPQAQAQAELLEWQLCVNTITNMNRKRGRDVGDVMKEKVGEIGLAQELADAENKKRGTTLTWRDVISALIPGQTANAPTKESVPKVDEESVDDTPDETKGGGK
jgi:capsid protein